MANITRTLPVTRILLSADSQAAAFDEGQPPSVIWFRTALPSGRTWRRTVLFLSEADIDAKNSAIWIFSSIHRGRTNIHGFGPVRS